MSTVSGAPRKLTPTELKKRERERKKRPTGRVDVEPVIDDSHFRDIEQRKRLLEQVREKPASEVTQAVQSAREAAKLAAETEQQLQEESVKAAQRIREAEEQIKLLEQKPYTVDAAEYYTIDGEPVSRQKIAEMRSDVEQYKQEYSEYVTAAQTQVGELQEYRSEALQAVGDWSRQVVERNIEYQEQKREFNTDLQEGAGFATKYQEESTGFDNRLKPPTPPGPVGGPAPGSPSARLSAEIAPILSKIEAPFEAVTKPIRARAQILGEEAAADPASYEGLAKWSAGIGLNILAGGVDVATLPVRPKLFAKQVQTVGQLTFDPEARGALGETIAADPVKFLAETAGSAALGVKLASFGRTAIREAPPTIRAIRAGATPRQAFAVATRKTAKVDLSKLSQFERQLYQYPEEVIHPELFETFTPETTYLADTTFNKKFGKITEKLIQDDFTIKARTGKWPKSGYLGFGRTGAELAPIIIPEEFAIPSTIYKFRRIPLTIPSGDPGVRFIDFTSAISKARIPFTQALAAIAITAKPRIKTITRKRVPKIQKPGTFQQNLQRFKQINTQKLKDIQTPSITPTQIELQLQKIDQPQIQKLDLPQIQAPVISIPEPPKPPEPPQETRFPFITPPSLRRKPIMYNILRLPEEPKKPVKKRKKVIAVEQRKDPLGFLKIMGYVPRSKKKRNKR